MRTGSQQALIYTASTTGRELCLFLFVRRWITGSLQELELRLTSLSTSPATCARRKRKVDWARALMAGGARLRGEIEGEKKVLCSSRR